MSKLYIPVLLGTTRVNNQSIHAARFVAEVGGSLEGVETEVINPSDFTFAGDGNDPESKDPKYSELTARADGFFIVIPEYNHSFPGSLKRMLDSEIQHYIHKPVGLAGVSAGPWGGVRAIESLTPVVRELGMVLTFADLQFPQIQDLFIDGTLQKEEYRTFAEAAWTELIWMSKVLKTGRETLPNKYHKD